MKIRRLLESPQPGDYHFYRQKNDIWMYDGTKLIPVPEKIARKLMQQAEADERSAKAAKDPSYSPENTDDFRNKLGKAKAELRSNETKKEVEYDKMQQDMQARKKAKGAKTYSVKGSDSVASIKSSIKSFLNKSYKPKFSREYSGASPYTLDPDSAIKVRQRMPKTKDLPTVFLYYDRSGSWDDQRKMKIGYDILHTFDQLVKKKQLDVKVFYFANSVEENEQTALSQGGTNGAAVVSHIKSCKPDNVVVMTDSDCQKRYMEWMGSSKVSVKGAAWLISVGSKAEGLESFISGQKETRTFFLD